MAEIAVAEGMDLGQASRIVRLTQLAPDIVEACLAGEDNALVLGNLMWRFLLACRLGWAATSVVVMPAG